MAKEEEEEEEKKREKVAAGAEKESPFCVVCILTGAWSHSQWPLKEAKVPPHIVLVELKGQTKQE